MDRRTDGQTDGRGALQYLPSRAFGAAGDKNTDRPQIVAVFAIVHLGYPGPWCKVVNYLVKRSHKCQDQK